MAEIQKQVFAFNCRANRKALTEFLNKDFVNVKIISYKYIPTPKDGLDSYLVTFNER
tara:strand:- start:483 stop:653 length:171 start_codon:yes stop_codon:yes gene_type:complete